MKRWAHRLTSTRARRTVVVTGVGCAAVAGLVVWNGAPGGTSRQAAARSAPSDPRNGQSNKQTAPSSGRAPGTSAPHPAATTSSTTSTTAPLTPACTALQHLESAPLPQRVGQLVFVGVTDQSTARQALDGSIGAGGVFLSGPTEWIDGGVLSSLESQAAVAPLVAADEEGGRVMRIADQFGPIPSAHQMQETMTVQAVQALAARRGHDLLSLGINMDFAPDTDLYDPSNPVINDRAFSSDPEQVVRYATAFAEGLEEAGVTPVIKHFPGHGRSDGDSEVGQAVTPPLESLEQADLIPFEKMAPSMPAVMVGHLTVPGLTEPGTPASLSPAAMGLLRSIGFRGLVLTDDLSMGAIREISSVPAAAVRAVEAGADMLLVTPSSEGEVATVEAALTRAVEEGAIPAVRLDEAISSVIKVKQNVLHCVGG